ncbi:hypothetical protein GH5_05535 [Leishmania sp. Ghana 2012 LV757]|uniref:hypothetical protein n=1 Tax=Leishmania sp. Ghana 2012 LV757 TaxID=2803181 RepID=UPI001B6604C6|nr:hypothetical protein GH5_05535 [Leishmania sp. Ghana 2012 LV757]
MDSHALSADAVDEAAMAVLPERGLVFSELRQMQLQLCKPKLLPIKSYALERLEKMEKKLAQEAREMRDAGRAHRQTLQEWTSPDLAGGGGVKPIPASSSPAMVAPAPLPDRGSTPLRGGSALPSSAAPAAASSTESMHAVSQETLSCPQTHTKEDAYADAPMSAPERSSQISSATDVSSSSSLASMTG